MRNMLKNIGLGLFLCSMSCFLVSCDDENEVTFDPQYDGVARMPIAEINLEEARKIQASGKVENVEVTDGVVVAPAVVADDAGLEGGFEETASTDPNSN